MKKSLFKEFAWARKPNPNVTRKKANTSGFHQVCYGGVYKVIGRFFVRDLKAV